MNESENSPSAFGKFFRGLRSGAVSGGLMMGIYSAVAAFGLLNPIGISAMLGTVLVTGLFSGTMAMFRGDSHKASVPVAAAGRTVPSVQVSGPSLSQEPSVAQAAEQEQSSGWANRVGRKNDAIQGILANGSMSDKDRASAILEARARDAEAGPSVSV